MPLSRAVGAPRRAHQVQQDALFLVYHGEAPPPPSATEPSQLRGPLHGGRDQPLKIWLPKCWKQKIQCPSGDVEQRETVVPVVER